MGILFKTTRKPKSKKIQVGLPPDERYRFTPLARHNAMDLSVVIFVFQLFNQTPGIPQGLAYKFLVMILLGISLKNSFFNKGSLITSTKLG